MKNQYISGYLDLLEESTDVSVDRVKAIRSYINYLEKDNEDLEGFLSAITKTVREFTYGKDVE